MPIKRSAILLMAITACSLSLLVFSSTKTLPATAPAQCVQLKCDSQLKETQVFSSWELFSQIMFRPTV